MAGAWTGGIVFDGKRPRPGALIAGREPDCYKGCGVRWNLEGVLDSWRWRPARGVFGDPFSSLPGAAFSAEDVCRQP